MNDDVESEPAAAMPDETRSDTPSDEPRAGAWAVALPIGIGAAIAGLAPWWVSGARLPLRRALADVRRPTPDESR